MKTLRAALLIGCVLAAWQALFWFVGSNALTSPLDTIAYMLQLLSSPSFYPHLIETAQAFAVALDSSGSMRELYFFGNDPHGERRKAAKDLAGRLSPTDRLAVIDFDSEAPEGRKFLVLAFRGVEGDRTGRGSVVLVPADHAKIAGVEKHGDLGKGVAGIYDAETGVIAEAASWPSSRFRR